MRKVITGTLIAFGALMSLGVGVAGADEVQVSGNYATMEACQADGPAVQISDYDGNDDYTGWQCREGDDGLYYLFLTS